MLWNIVFANIGCSFKFLLKVGVEESIVNAPLVGLQDKNTNNAKSVIRGAFTIESSTPTLRINLNEHPMSMIIYQHLKKNNQNFVRPLIQKKNLFLDVSIFENLSQKCFRNFDSASNGDSFVHGNNFKST
jgi:hypothetical protein